MKKLITTLTACLIILGFTSNLLMAQPLDLVEKEEVYTKEHIPQKNPIPYPFVREADVTWEKTIWREVNLREKMNHPLFFPTTNLGDRKNLVNLILDVLQNPEPEHPVYAYSPTLRSTDYEFTAPLSLDEAIKPVGGYTFNTYRDSITGQAVTDTVGFDVDPDQVREVTRLYIKEKWFFDKRYSMMKVRIIGICPVRLQPQLIDNPTTGLPEPTGSIDRINLFWIYYPEFRWYFSRNFVFNRNNDAQPTSFDDLFMQRRFSSFIYRESNVYNNRDVRDYSDGMEQMFEAERIKQEIFEYEHDLWEY